MQKHLLSFPWFSKTAETGHENECSWQKNFESFYWDEKMNYGHSSGPS